MYLKKDLKELTRKELIELFKNNKIKGYRAKQVYNWLYQNGIENLLRMKNIPERLRKTINNEFNITDLKLSKKLLAEDGTIKYLWELSDKEKIESVYLPNYDKQRYTVCLSTQLGCAMGCKFCATGLSGLIRNLTPGEIVDQLYKIQVDISKEDEFRNPRISNVVFMGMGEPLNNIDALFRSIDIFNDKHGFNIGMRKMTVSTSGIIDGIKRIAIEKPQLGLAISLNASNNHIRDNLMPINKKYPIEQLFKAVNFYQNKTNRRVTFEYVLIKKINDSEKNAKELVRLLKSFNCHVNLIPLNPVKELSLERPEEERIKKFESILKNNNINTTLRKERGTHIKAACGQLRKRVN